MTAILLCGEGLHDIGKSEWSREEQRHKQLDGWMQPVLRKLFGDTVEIKTLRLREINLVPGHKLPNLTGHGRRAALAKFRAKTEGCDRVVFVTDADTNEHSECASKFESIKAGFAAIQNGVLGTGCVPQSTSESWLLADSNAWSEVAPNGEPSLPKRSPEALWGSQDDPTSNHPKQVFTRACAASGLEPDRQTRVELAEATDLAILAERCPQSVPPFLDACQNPV